MSHEKHKHCIDACLACAIECDHCSSACLQEENVKMMARCISLDELCSEICRLAASAMAKGSEFVRQICQLCADICEACAAECSKHKEEHCQVCAKACRTCAEECRKMALAG